MCGEPEQLNFKTEATLSSQESESVPKAVPSERSFSVLLELAANNDVEGFKQYVSDPFLLSETGSWYYRQRASRKMVLMERTALMVAAMYGSVEVVKHILSISKVDINRSCDPDQSTALHCAASSGSIAAIDIVKLLLVAGADPNATDCHGHRPFDVIVSPPNLPHMKLVLKELLKTDDSTMLAATYEPIDLLVSSAPMKKVYPIDSSIPDINNSIYSSDEFRMFSFKIVPCSRCYSHDWTECPFAHPSENARRRDPKKFHYSCVPCPDHRRGQCKRGDDCEYAHGVFESLLHPAQYRTQICRDGTSCTRRVCFFAHTMEELRPLYTHQGSTVPSHSVTSANTTAIDVASALDLLPGNGISQASMPWLQQKIPTLNLSDSHLRYLNARRSVPVESFPLQKQQLFTTSNLDELLSSEVSSPTYSFFSPSQKSAVLNKLQQQESMLTPAKTNLFSPNNFEHASLGGSLPGMMSSQSIESQAPLSSNVFAFANREDKQQQKQLRSFSPWDFGSRRHDIKESEVHGFNLW